MIERSSAGYIPLYVIGHPSLLPKVGLSTSSTSQTHRVLPFRFSRTRVPSSRAFHTGGSVTISVLMSKRFILKNFPQFCVARCYHVQEAAARISSVSRFSALVSLPDNRAFASDLVAITSRTIPFLWLQT